MQESEPVEGEIVEGELVEGELAEGELVVCGARATNPGFCGLLELGGSASEGQRGRRHWGSRHARCGRHSTNPKFGDQRGTTKPKAAAVLCMPRVKKNDRADPSPGGTPGQGLGSSGSSGRGATARRGTPDETFMFMVLLHIWLRICALVLIAQLVRAYS